MRLLLSLFPGVDLFGKAFTEHGFSVVKGPDIMLGDDIRDFHTPPGRFDGVIGGPPCQNFSMLNRNRDSPAGQAMLAEFKRVVKEARPAWWLMENVTGVPDLKIDGYSWQRFNLDLAWFTDCSRLRSFQFGHADSLCLDVAGVGPALNPSHYAALARDSRPFDTLKALQGLPPDFNLPWFNVAAKKRAVGNGVPMALGRYLAQTINKQIYGTATRQAHSDVTARRCLCQCGRSVYGKAKYAGSNCRKRAQRKRDRPGRHA